MTDWIPVEERLPEDGVAVLVWIPASGCWIGERYHLYWMLNDECAAGDQGITHWMPLPEPPEEKPVFEWEPAVEAEAGRLHDDGESMSDYVCWHNFAEELPAEKLFNVNRSYDWYATGYGWIALVRDETLAKDQFEFRKTPLVNEPPQP